MIKGKNLEIKDVAAIEKDKKVPHQTKQKMGEVEKDSDLSEEDLEVKGDVMMVEPISKENDSAIQVAFMLRICHKQGNLLLPGVCTS